jgi:DNA-binding transcriptional LysR family regulator
MRLRQIEVFHAVYAHGSISTAARALNVSQPSVSKVLSHAEDQLGFKLFRRVKGRLLPTDEAHALFHEVKDVFERLDSLKQAARNLRAGVGGHIRAAILPAMGLGIAPAAVARLRRARPDVTLDLHTLHYDEVARALYEREVDFALAYDAIEHPRLVSERIGEGELMMLFRRGEFPNAGPRLDLSLLEGRDYVGSGSTGPVSEIFAREVEARGLAITEAISASAYYVAAALVRHGVGVAVVDEFTARFTPGADIEFRPLDPPLTFGVYCVHLDDRPLSTLAALFVDTLKQEMAQLGREP